MNTGTDAVTLFVAVFAATLMGAAYATARFAFREWRSTLAKVPALRDNAVSAMLRAAVVVAVTMGVVFVLATA